MKLLELFNQPSSATWDWMDDYNSSSPQLQYLITLPNGREYVLTATRLTRGMWIVGFMLKMGNGGTTGITKTGNAPTVFSAVAACLRNLVQTVHPKAIAFTGKDVSRSRLYDVLSKKMAAELGWEVKTEIEDDVKGYVISEPKKKGFFRRR